MNLVATREALDRFAHELPAGTAGDRLRRLAETTRALYDQAAAARGASTAWADHDLGVLVAEALGAAPHGADQAFRAAAEALHLGVRRRLLDALAGDPDDLALALALALGASQAASDRSVPAEAEARLVDDLRAVGAALARPQAGPRLTEAATRLVIHAAASSADALKKAAGDLAPVVRDAVERLSRRLPDHPDLALDRIRLVLVAARASDGHERSAALSMARGLLSDHEARFGPSEAQREIVGQVLQLRGKEAAPGDVARDALALIASDARDHALDARRTTKLLRAVARAGALDREVAKKVKDLVQPAISHGAAGEQWGEALSFIYEALGDEAALLALSEKAIAKDPKDQHAARALFERLLRNLRQRLGSPFETPVLDATVHAVPFQALGTLSADDIDALVHLLEETFGAERAVTFVKRLVQAKELEGRDFVWKKALAVAERARDVDAVVELGRRALQRKGAGGAGGGPVELRLALARALVERGVDLDEADDVLKPIASERGPHTGEAQALRARVKADPRYREARLQTLLAFEQQLGIGSDKRFELRVAYTSASYALAEVAERPAPDFYEHKHLRVMLRPEDLPDGVAPTDLKKGDKILAPVRGQDATFEKDKDNFRIYWVSDQRAVRLDLGNEDLGKRLATEEAAFGIGSGKIVPLKIAWDAKKSRLTARLLDRGGNEFRSRPKLAADQLPDGVVAERVGGRGRRFWGLVVKDGDGYAVSGKVLAADPNAPAEPTSSEGAASEAAASEAAASEAAASEAAEAETGPAVEVASA
ncbi:MAG: hypothetical protein IT385_11025 [Deltaproteobacteria bacterium]|nr:hypothetical protein [Deltaproteobacteria bacterium]